MTKDTQAEDGVTKTCSKCKESKPPEAFRRESSRRDGLYPSCKECGNAYRARHYAKNKDRILAQMADYRRANPEVIRERKARWYQENREAIAEQTSERYARNREARIAHQSEYQRQNPHILWANTYKKRMRRLGFDPVVEHFTKADVVATYGDTCFYCEVGGFEQLDHYIPVTKAGVHTLANVRPSCAACNVSKRNHDPEVWIQGGASGAAGVTDVDRAALAALYAGVE